MSNVDFVRNCRRLAEHAIGAQHHDVRILPDQLLRLVELAEDGMTDSLTSRHSGGRDG